MLNLKNRIMPICRDMVLQYVDRVWLSDCPARALAPSRLCELRYRRYRHQVVHAALERIREDHDLN